MDSIASRKGRVREPVKYLSLFTLPSTSAVLPRRRLPPFRPPPAAIPDTAAADLVRHTVTAGNISAQIACLSLIFLQPRYLELYLRCRNTDEFFIV